MALLRQCTANRARENTSAVLKTALRSSELLTELRSRVPLDFSFRQAGKLVLLSKDEQIQAALASSELKRQLGSRVEVITFAEACEIEPCLVRFKKDYAGAVWSTSDEVGDAKVFTAGLARWLEDHREFELQLGTKVLQIEQAKTGIVCVNTSRGRVKADAVVVCLGADSASLLEPLGIKTSIYPVRGYSVTLPATEGSTSTSITDLGNKIVFSRLGDQVRIAGFADILGFDTHRDASRVQDLIRAARGIAPEIADFDAESIGEWGGYRPLTPDSRPLVGRTTVQGLFLNTGHGMLGWTLACATAHQLASEIQA